MKALRVLFAILLSLVLFCLQTALLSLFVADRLVSPSALTTAIEGSGLVDSIVEDTLTDMGMDASAADPAPLNAYAGELVSGVVTALVRGGELPTVEAGELTTLLSGVLAPALGLSADEAGALSSLLSEQLAAELNDMLASRTSLAVALGMSASTLAALEMLFSPMVRILLGVAVLLFGLLLVLALDKKRRSGRTGLIWWSVTAALAGIAVLLCGAGMDTVLQAAANADTAQFVAALQQAVGGAFTLFGLLGIALCAALLGLYIATRPKRRRKAGGNVRPRQYAGPPALKSACGGNPIRAPAASFCPICPPACTAGVTPCRPGRTAR